MLDKPPPRSDCIRYLNAFRLLGGSRMWDEVGPKPIPVSEIESYLNLAGFTDPDTKMKYLRLIRVMDLVELEVLNDRLKKSRAKA